MPHTTAAVSAIEPPTVNVVERGLTFFGLISAAVIALWGFTRIILRPLWDEQNFESWKRKAPDYEKFMREKIFKDDIAERAEMKSMLMGALSVADRNAAAIDRVAAEVGTLATQSHAQGMLLHSLPHMATTLEEIRIEMNAMRRDGGKHGEAIASISALIEFGERRHLVRRLNDSAPDGAGEGEVTPT